MKRNDWTAKFGAARRAKDRSILQDCERRLEAEEKAVRPISGAGNPAAHRSATGGSADNAMRVAIAKAFGRPLA